jgi:hypothetical protein
VAGTKRQACRQPTGTHEAGGRQAGKRLRAGKKRQAGRQAAK